MRKAEKPLRKKENEKKVKEKKEKRRYNTTEQKAIEWRKDNHMNSFNEDEIKNEEWNRERKIELILKKRIREGKNERIKYVKKKKIHWNNWNPWKKEGSSKTKRNEEKENRG